MGALILLSMPPSSIGKKMTKNEFEFSFIVTKNCAFFSLKHREIEWKIWRRRTMTLTL